MECNVKYHGIPRVVAPKVRSSRDSVRRRRTLEMKRVGILLPELGLYNQQSWR